MLDILKGKGISPFSPMFLGIKVENSTPAYRRPMTADTLLGLKKKRSRFKKKKSKNNKRTLIHRRQQIKSSPHQKKKKSKYQNIVDPAAQ